MAQGGAITVSVAILACTLVLFDALFPTATNRKLVCGLPLARYGAPDCHRGGSTSVVPSGDVQPSRAPDVQKRAAFKIKRDFPPGRVRSYARFSLEALAWLCLAWLFSLALGPPILTGWTRVRCTRFLTDGCGAPVSQTSTPLPLEGPLERAGTVHPHVQGFNPSGCCVGVR